MGKRPARGNAPDGTVLVPQRSTGAARRTNWIHCGPRLDKWTVPILAHHWCLPRGSAQVGQIRHVDQLPRQDAGLAGRARDRAPLGRRLFRDDLRIFCRFVGEDASFSAGERDSAALVVRAMALDLDHRQVPEHLSRPVRGTEVDADAARERTRFGAVRGEERSGRGPERCERWPRRGRSPPRLTVGPVLP